MDEMPLQETPQSARLHATCEACGCGSVRSLSGRANCSAGARLVCSRVPIRPLDMVHLQEIGLKNIRFTAIWKLDIALEAAFPICAVMKKTIHQPEHLVLAELLRDLRLEANLTQVEVAARLDVGQSRISELERGMRRLDLIEISELAVAYGTTLIDLVVSYESRLKRKRSPSKR